MLMMILEGGDDRHRSSHGLQIVISVFMILANVAIITTVVSGLRGGAASNGGVDGDVDGHVSDAAAQDRADSDGGQRTSGEGASGSVIRLVR